MFCYKLLSIFIIHQDLSFGGIALKIEFVVFVYELINYEIIFLLCNYRQGQRSSMVFEGVKSQRPCQQYSLQDYT